MYASSFHIGKNTLSLEKGAVRSVAIPARVAAAPNCQSSADMVALDGRRRTNTGADHAVVGATATGAPTGPVRRSCTAGRATEACGSAHAGMADAVRLRVGRHHHLLRGGLGDLACDRVVDLVARCRRRTEADPRETVALLRSDPRDSGSCGELAILAIPGHRGGGNRGRHRCCRFGQSAVAGRRRVRLGRRRTVHQRGVARRDVSIRAARRAGQLNRRSFSTTTTPRSLSAKSFRSASASCPIVRPAGIATFLSITHRCNCAPGPTYTPGNRIDSLTTADASTYVSGPRIERSTDPPDTIDPAHNKLFSMFGRSPPGPWSILAGGSGSCRLYIGHSRL